MIDIASQLEAIARTVDEKKSDSGEMISVQMRRHYQTPIDCAAESTRSLGHLVSRQLMAAGERVVDVPATMGVAGSPIGVREDPNTPTRLIPGRAIAALRHRARPSP